MEKKSNVLLIIVSSIVVLLPMIPGIVFWNRLPDKIVTRFDFSGAATGYSSKWFAVIGLYIFMLAMHLIVAFAVRGQDRNKISSKAGGLMMMICPMVSIMLAVFIYGYALGIKIEMQPVMMLFLGFLYLIVGNYLPKIRRNWVVGIKVKWTLESDRNWDSTSRFSGFFMFIAGFLIVIFGVISFFTKLSDELMSVIMFVLIVIPVVVAVLYSYIYYCKHKDEAGYFSDRPSS